MTRTEFTAEEEAHFWLMGATIARASGKTVPPLPEPVLDGMIWRAGAR